MSSFLLVFLSAPCPNSVLFTIRDFQFMWINVYKTVIKFSSVKEFFEISKNTKDTLDEGDDRQFYVRMLTLKNPIIGQSFKLIFQIQMEDPTRSRPSLAGRPPQLRLCGRYQFCVGP